MRSDYFDREPAELAEDTIRWPAEREDWADEIPAPVRVEGACERMRSRLRPRSRRRGAEPSSPESEGLRARTVAGWRARLLGAIERTLRRFRALPKSRRPGALRHAHQRIRMYGAEAAFRFAQIYRYRPPAARRLPANAVARLDPDRLWRRVGRYVEPLVEGSPPEGLPERKRAHARLLAALYHRRAKRDERALRHVEAALDLGVGDRNLWPARYVRLQLLTRRRAWQQAAEMADDLPPRNSRYFAPYAYRAALAVRRVDQDDRFLGIAKAAFRDRQPEAGPFERALYTDVLRTLVSYEFGPRTIELLEELGPRSRIDRRIEQYARTAIDEGRPEQAADAARWLLRERDDARLEPRYRGILAMAAFLRDEPEQFRTYISEITRRPEALREAIPRERRAAFFAHSDAELARILRRILPMMAGWGRTPAGRERREKWLEIVVEEIQQFLRNTESSLARDRLTKLYRLASSLLADHPRGYAERVGSASSTPLVLGTVRVTKPNLAEHEPLVWATFPVPDTLTPIPRDDAPPSKWAFRWNPDDDGEDDDE